MLSRLSAVLSSTYSSGYPASKAIDASYTSISVSSYAVGNWLSVQIPAGTHVGEVRVYNRRDATQPASQPQLGSFEIWVASVAGDTSSSSAVRCGDASFDAATEPEPYVLWCGGVLGSYVTLKQTGAATYLSIAELEIFPGLSAPPSPPMPPPLPPLLPRPPRPPPPADRRLRLTDAFQSGGLLLKSTTCHGQFCSASAVGTKLACLSSTPRLPQHARGSPNRVYQTLPRQHTHSHTFQ